MEIEIVEYREDQLFWKGTIMGVDVPIIESLIRLGLVICKRDCLKEGRSPKELGIAD